MLRTHEAVRYRQRAYREAYKRLGTMKAAAAELGVSPQAIAYAVNPAFAAKRREQMRRRYHRIMSQSRELGAQ